MNIPTLNYICIMCGGLYPKAEMALLNMCVHCQTADRLADRIDCVRDREPLDDMETEFNRWQQAEANRKRGGC